MQRSPVEVVATIPAEWQRGELAVDGPSLTVVLQDQAMTHKLAVLAAHCSGVVVSRSSPSQKAAIVKMMKRYEQWKAAGSRRGLWRWYAMHKRRLQVGFGRAWPGLGVDREHIHVGTQRGWGGCCLALGWQCNLCRCWVCSGKRCLHRNFTDR